MRIKKDQSQTPGRYATRADFYEVVKKHMGSLYLLAFLLTANHVDAERCVGAAIEDTLDKNYVLKDWTRSWTKRSLIKNAIRIVSPESATQSENRDLWFDQKEPGPQGVINPVTRLTPFERFVFILVILEGYSIRECSVLLGCAVERVVNARIDAVRRLPLLNRPFAPREAPQPELAMGGGMALIPRNVYIDAT
jgi:DNA-directed RNA polymerase specialized sigma24 family protein